jgi:membrane-associated phospholipid phosphatase
MDRVVCLMTFVLVAGWALGQAANPPVEPFVGDSELSSSIQILPSPPRFNFDTPGYLPPGEDPGNRLFMPFVKHMVGDQKQFWTAPFRDKPIALAPVIGTLGLLIPADPWISRQVPDKPSQLNRSLSISNYSVYSLLAAGGGAFIAGQIKHDDHMSETGLLSGEAALNSTAAGYLLKFVTQRPRPMQGDGNGTFFTGGDSFPSEHAAIAWSIASVIAHEYPGPLTQILAYGLATTVTMTRVTAKQHFTSDVIIGSALGWYMGRQVYRAHHDHELGGAPWGDVIEHPVEKGPRNPALMGSPELPLGSWVYPEMERLAALGYIDIAYLGQRPWTRMQCAQFLEDMREHVRYKGDASPQAESIYEALSEEFRDESARLDGAANLGVYWDTAYVRGTGISGTPLTDGYHFAQTIMNDYGRPYGQGMNFIAGFSTHALAGPFAFNLQGEFQHAPAIPDDPASVQNAIAAADQTLPVSHARSMVDRFDLIDATVALNLHDVQFSFGKQSSWLGVGDSGALLMTNNAEPIVALKISTVTPYRIPGISKVLGPFQTEFFLGQLAGHRFEVNGNQLLGPGGIRPQPYLHGTKVSFKPIRNLEVGVGFTAQFVGPGVPFTFHNFARTLFAHTSGTDNPGKRLSEMDFSYRIPGIRDWLTFNLDMMVVDEFTPINSRRRVWNPGIYMPKFPKVPNLQIRVDGFRDPFTNEFAPGFVYYGLRRFRDGYTNDGNLMGSWLGRAGQGGQAWFTYSFSPRNRLQAGYRLQEVQKDFIGGGRAADYTLRGDILLSPNVALSGLLQYEQWHFPVLAPEEQSNFTTSFQLTFYPHWERRK